LPVRWQTIQDASDALSDPNPQKQGEDDISAESQEADFPSDRIYHRQLQYGSPTGDENFGLDADIEDHSE